MGFYYLKVLLLEPLANTLLQPTKGKTMKLFKVSGVYFSNKQAAKEYRNVHGGKVELGPDHRRYGIKIKTHYGSQGHKQGSRTK